MRKRGILSAGAALLWRRQRVLWWLFAVNLAIGLLAAAPVRVQLRNLDNSMAASDSLYHEMNMFRLTEAIRRPEGLPSAFFSGSVLLMLVSFAFLVFAMGGVLESLVSDRTLMLGEFLRASADYFWRMVRLLVVFAILLTPLLIAQGSVANLTDWLEGRSDFEQLGFIVTVGIGVVLTLIAFVVRVWIDVAQVDAVVRDEVAVRRSLSQARRLLKRSFWRVYGAVSAVQMLLAIVTLLLLAVWVRLPHEAVGGTFLIGELIVVLWLACRLWQKAVACAWYQERVAAEYVPIAVRVEPDVPTLGALDPS